MSSTALLDRVLAGLGESPAPADAASSTPPLPSALPVPDLADASVRAAALVASRLARECGWGASEPVVDARRTAAAYSSERHFRLDGEAPSAWAPLSGFWSTGDGWLRTHGNYPHHAARLLSALGLAADAGPDEVRERLGRLSAVDAAQRIVAHGGIAARVAERDPGLDGRLAERPVVERAGGGDARPRPWRDGPLPLSGVRVLDLTRVIAGPVATRTLAGLGADVLRVDSPDLPEIGWQHLDSGAGKRSSLLDVGGADRGRFIELLREADVVVLGYRPDGLARLGLTPEAIADAVPGIVVARLSAWGFGPGEADRRGFDSIVQAASGIAVVEGTHERPGALPAQALDHSAGYLLAAAIMSALRRQRAEGGTHEVATSLRRVAAELLTMPTTARADADPDLTDQTVEHDTAVGRVRSVRPAVRLAGMADDFPHPPHPWGSDAPEWLER